MLGTNENRREKVYFLNIKDGKILHRDGLIENEYDFIEGNLEKIFTKEREFNGEKTLYWYIILRDEGELVSIGLPYSSGVFKSIVLALASCNTLGLDSKIRIETYLKDGRTKVVVYNGGKKLDWVTKELPPVPEQMIGGKLVKDDSERMDYIKSLVANITRQL